MRNLSEKHSYVSELIRINVQKVIEEKKKHTHRLHYIVDSEWISGHRAQSTGEDAYKDIGHDMTSHDIPSHPTWMTEWMNKWIDE